jgi:ribosome-associated toxin RatA of RatAB toxin-antitoxin module
MRSRRRIGVVGALLGALLPFPSLADDGTTAALDDRLAKGEVVLEFQSVAGSAQQALHAALVLNAEPERVFAVVDDCANYAHWMPRITSASEVTREGERSICKWVVHLPFPMTDRSTEVAVTSRRAPGLWTRAFKQTRGDFQRNEGLWTLTAFRGDPKRTRLEYRLNVGIDLILPDVFVKSLQRDGMMDMVKSLRQQVEKRGDP